VDANTQPKNDAINIRSLLAGFVGNILEWYDFTVYGYFASVIGVLFFPSEDKIASLIAAFGVFAAGYLMRPLGGVLFGIMGDRLGRQKALSMSILLMAIPTTLLGCLPTHDQWGWAAAASLISIRLLQGISVGGEFTGSISFLVEKAPHGKRGFFGSWTTFGVMGGMLLGSGIGALITNILTPEQVHHYGWRIPFLLGFLVGILGLYLRKTMGQDDTIENLKREGGLSPSPLRELWSEHRNSATKLIFFNWGFAVSVYLIFIYLTSYLHSFLGVPMHLALSANTIAMVFLMCIIPFMGKLSDRAGRKPMLLGALVGFALLTIPLFGLLFKCTFAAILSSLLVFALMEGVLQGVAPAAMAEIFPARIRYTGLSVSYNIAMALFGGTAPVVATWLIKITGENHWMPSLYLAASALIATIAVSRFQETYKKPLN
jgi:MFS transporter, MHS family, proline/betaine transporter